MRLLIADDSRPVDCTFYLTCTSPNFNSATVRPNSPRPSPWAPPRICWDPEVRKPVLDAFYGSNLLPNGDYPNSPIDLANKLSDEQIKQLPPTLLIVSPLDPEEILEPNARFAKVFKAKDFKGDNKFTPQQHNHLSTVWCLMSGEGEEYTKLIVDFFNEP